MTDKAKAAAASPADPGASDGEDAKAASSASAVASTGSSQEKTAAGSGTTISSSSTTLMTLEVVQSSQASKRQQNSDGEKHFAATSISKSSESQNVPRVPGASPRSTGSTSASKTAAGTRKKLASSGATSNPPTSAQMKVKQEVEAAWARKVAAEQLHATTPSSLSESGVPLKQEGATIPGSSAPGSAATAPSSSASNIHSKVDKDAVLEFPLDKTLSAASPLGSARAPGALTPSPSLKINSKDDSTPPGGTTPGGRSASKCSSAGPVRYTYDVSKMYQALGILSTDSFLLALENGDGAGTSTAAGGNRFAAGSTTTGGSTMSQRSGGSGATPRKQSQKEAFRERFAQMLQDYRDNLSKELFRLDLCQHDLDKMTFNDWKAFLEQHKEAVVMGDDGQHRLVHSDESEQLLSSNNDNIKSTTSAPVGENAKAAGSPASDAGDSSKGSSVVNGGSQTSANGAARRLSPPARGTTASSSSVDGALPSHLATTPTTTTTNSSVLWHTGNGVLMAGATSPAARGQLLPPSARVTKPLGGSTSYPGSAMGTPSFSLPTNSPRAFNYPASNAMSPIKSPPRAPEYIKKNKIILSSGPSTPTQQDAQELTSQREYDAAARQLEALQIGKGGAEAVAIPHKTPVALAAGGAASVFPGMPVSPYGAAYPPGAAPPGAGAVDPAYQMYHMHLAQMAVVAGYPPPPVAPHGAFPHPLTSPDGTPLQALGYPAPPPGFGTVPGAPMLPDAQLQASYQQYYQAQMAAMQAQQNQLAIAAAAKGAASPRTPGAAKGGVADFNDYGGGRTPAGRSESGANSLSAGMSPTAPPMSAEDTFLMMRDQPMSLSPQLKAILNAPNVETEFFDDTNLYVDATGTAPLNMSTTQQMQLHYQEQATGAVAAPASKGLLSYHGGNPTHLGDVVGEFTPARSTSKGSKNIKGGAGGKAAAAHGAVQRGGGISTPTTLHKAKAPLSKADSQDPSSLVSLQPEPQKLASKRVIELEPQSMQSQSPRGTDPLPPGLEDQQALPLLQDGTGAAPSSTTLRSRAPETRFDYSLSETKRSHKKDELPMSESTAEKIKKIKELSLASGTSAPQSTSPITEHKTPSSVPTSGKRKLRQQAAKFASSGAAAVGVPPASQTEIPLTIGGTAQVLLAPGMVYPSGTVVASSAAQVVPRPRDTAGGYAQPSSVINSGGPALPYQGLATVPGFSEEHLLGSRAYNDPYLQMYPQTPGAGAEAQPSTPYNLPSGTITASAAAARRKAGTNTTSSSSSNVVAHMQMQHLNSQSGSLLYGAHGFPGGNSFLLPASTSTLGGGNTSGENTTGTGNTTTGSPLSISGSGSGHPVRRRGGRAGRRQQKKRAMQALEEEYQRLLNDHDPAVAAQLLQQLPLARAVGAVALPGPGGGAVMCLSQLPADQQRHLPTGEVIVPNYFYNYEDLSQLQQLPLGATPSAASSTAGGEGDRIQLVGAGEELLTTKAHKGSKRIAGGSPEIDEDPGLVLPACLLEAGPGLDKLTEREIQDLVGLTSPGTTGAKSTRGAAGGKTIARMGVEEAALAAKKPHMVLMPRARGQREKQDADKGGKGSRAVSVDSAISPIPELQETVAANLVRVVGASPPSRKGSLASTSGVNYDKGHNRRTSVSSSQLGGAASSSIKGGKSSSKDPSSAITFAGPGSGVNSHMMNKVKGGMKSQHMKSGASTTSSTGTSTVPLGSSRGAAILPPQHLVPAFAVKLKKADADLIEIEHIDNSAGGTVEAEPFKPYRCNAVTSFSYSSGLAQSQIHESGEVSPLTAFLLKDTSSGAPVSLKLESHAPARESAVSTTGGR
ncbi:unnamed protein product [Amoebophrya sp. A25]|nr:unnamed protein product [Amoebophrya sp. A25]|eukprot:GSA25T00000646001.1